MHQATKKTSSSFLFSHVILIVVVGPWLLLISINIKVAIQFTSTIFINVRIVIVINTIVVGMSTVLVPRKILLRTNHQIRLHQTTKISTQRQEKCKNGPS
jgi:hypothetical protein